MSYQDDQNQFNEMLKKHGFETPTISSYVGKGWWPLLEELFPKLKEQGVTSISQIKEKFGTLRLYLGTYPDSMTEEQRKKVWELCCFAEAETEKICQTCGEMGTKRIDNGWVSIRCDPCSKKNRARRKDSPSDAPSESS